MNRDFKGIWIPKEIWLSKNLTMNEKFFLAEIDSLDNEKGCYANNAYFAEFFQLSKSRVSQIINSLAKKEFIDITYIYKGKTKEIDRRIIRINREKYFTLLKGTECDTPLSEIKGPLLDTKDPPFENAKDNNTCINNKEEEEEEEERPISEKDKKKNTSEAEKVNTKLNDYSEEIKELENYTGMELKGLVHKKTYTKWRKEWGVTFELIIKAAELMCKLAKTPNLNYLEQILLDWKRQNIISPEGVDRAVNEHKKARNTTQKAINNGNKAANAFNDYGNYEIYVPPKRD